MLMSDLAKKEQIKFRLDKCTWEKNNLNFTNCCFGLTITKQDDNLEVLLSSSIKTQF